MKIIKYKIQINTILLVVNYYYTILRNIRIKIQY